MKTLATLLAALLLAACENEGPLERAGEATDEAAEDVGDTAESAVGAIDQSITLSTMWKTRSKTRLNRAVRTSHPEAAHSMQRAGYENTRS